MRGSDQNHWKHTWPSAQLLSELMCCNRDVFHDRNILEIGSGATGVCGLTAAKLGAKRVWLTDHPDLKEALDCLKENVQINNVEGICEVTGLDWQDKTSVDAVVDRIASRLDRVIASDVFFDPHTFRGLADTFARLLINNPRITVWFAYHERDDNWTAELIFKEYPQLVPRLIRRIDQSRETIQIISVTSKSDNMMFGGIEGGGTSSKLVITDASGTNQYWSESHGTNYYLQGVETVGDQVATWIRRVAQENHICLPLEALGMGLSGAEDEEINGKFVEYLKQFHGDIAKNIHLTSDAVCTVAANFEEQGIVLIAGTGSSCRMLMKDGNVRGVGGWGHAIGDGCSAYWLANRAIRVLFDHDDGLEESKYSVETIRKLLCQHFNICDKIGILDFLYQKFEKHTIAQFTKTMANHIDDPAIRQIFFDGGELLGKHVTAIVRHLPADERKQVDIVLVGNVFNSWNALRDGFVKALKSSEIRRVNLFQPSEQPAIGAAAMAAKRVDVLIEHAKNKVHKDVIEL